MLDGPQRRSEEAQVAEYWRREADRLQRSVYDLVARIEELTAPATMIFQGVEDGVAYERSLMRIPSHAWDVVAERYPHRKSWDWVEASGVCFLLSPVVAVDSRRQDPVGRND
jgi:hypothetical protein